MTQVLFDLAYLDAFLAHFGGRCPIPLLVGVWPMPSHQLAVRVHNEVPGMVVPDPVLGRLRAAGADAVEEGRTLARELIAESREKAAGVYLVAPFRRPLGILDVL
jgi:5,10-methylenetetrahydrofolate reductase